MGEVDHESTLSLRHLSRAPEAGGSRGSHDSLWDLTRMTTLASAKEIVAGPPATHYCEEVSHADQH
jgi:hypothetical protein